MKVQQFINYPLKGKNLSINEIGEIMVCLPFAFLPLWCVFFPQRAMTSS